MLLTASACVHRPQRAELRTLSRDHALDLMSQAIRLRYDAVRLDEARLGRLQSSDRYESNDPPIRTRAYLALTPGELGWAVEITVVREELTGSPFRLEGPPASWTYMGRDRDMEKFLADALSTWLRESPTSVFAESAPASAPSRPAR
jgi:hypothetical protein